MHCLHIYFFAIGTNFQKGNMVKTRLIEILLYCENNFNVLFLFTVNLLENVNNIYN